MDKMKAVNKIASCADEMVAAPKISVSYAGSNNRLIVTVSITVNSSLSHYLFFCDGAVCKYA